MSAIAPSASCSMAPPPGKGGSVAPSGGLVATPELIQRIQDVTTRLAALVQALAGQQALTPPPTTTPTTPALPGPPAPNSLPTAPPVAPVAPGTVQTADPLQGFGGTGDPAERALLGATMNKLGTTSVGQSLLNSVRNKGVNLDIVSDAEFNQRSKGATDAVGVFIGSSTAPPTVLVRGSALSANSEKQLTHILSHELTHAAQWVSGETKGGYAQTAGAAASGMSAAQLQVGGVLQLESGAEFVASAIAAQISDPVTFQQKAAGNLAGAYAINWQSVSDGGYNPQKLAIAQVVSPTAMGLVQQGLATR